MMLRSKFPVVAQRDDVSDMLNGGGRPLEQFRQHNLKRSIKIP